MNRPLIPARVRRYAYPIVTAGAALLGGYGLVSDELVPLWVAFGAALLGVSTATAHRPNPDRDRPEEQ